MHQTPLEKLNCFATAFDLAMAELKGAIIDVFALSCGMFFFLILQDP